MAGRSPTEDLYVYLGARLKELRVDRGKESTPGVVARAIGITPQSLHNIEAGRRRVAVHRLVALCRYLGQDPAEVLAHVLDDMPDIN